MSRNINKIVITGNMTREPELRRTNSGMSILTIGLASNGQRKNKQTGEWEDVPCYVDCTMFGERAEKVANYLHKGTRVEIEGKLSYSTWEKDGQKRSKHEIIIDEIEFHNAQPGGYQQPPVQQGYYAPPQPVPQYQPNYGQMPVTQAVQQAVANVAQQVPQPMPAPMPAPQPVPQPMPAPQQAQMPVIEADTSVYDDDIPF